MLSSLKRLFLKNLEDKYGFLLKEFLKLYLLKKSVNSSSMLSKVGISIYNSSWLESDLLNDKVGKNGVSFIFVFFSFVFLTQHH